MVTKLNDTQTNILGAAIVELLDGRLTDETIAAVDSINRGDVPALLNNMVGYMHGMSTYPPLRESIITSLIEEIRGATEEALEKRRGEETSLNTWGLTQSLLFDMLENEHVEDMIEEEIEMLPDPEQVEGWAAPLFSHAKSSKSRHQKLMLELLDVLEEILQKRRTELTK